MMSEEVDTTPGMFKTLKNLITEYTLLYLLYSGSAAASSGETMESAAETAPVTQEPKSTEEEEDIQLEPTKSEMERERLMSRAEQVWY